MQTRAVAIFQCSSTCQHSVQGLTSIAVNGLKRNVVTVMPDMINQWINENNALLMLPGGTCSGWDRELPQDFQESLANWISKGNRVFATCAGAYYCSKQTIYSLPETESINKTRNVQLFQGSCVGPLYKKLKIVKIRWYNGKIGHVVLLWGGVFEGEMQSNIKVLATFECRKSKYPAVILSKVGNGLAILSSVHWEWDSQDVIKCNPKLDTFKMVKKLDASKEFRQDCIKEIMQNLSE